MLDWDDPLWTAEYKRGAIYTAEVEYMDGFKMVGDFKYEGPSVNRETVNGYERLIIPRFSPVSQMRTGYTKTFKVLARNKD